MSWQPIETAPKDRRILLYYPGPWAHVAIGCWDTDQYAQRPRPFWISDGGHFRRSEARARQPTHWQELPKGPVTP